MKKIINKLKKIKGFSLIELLAVIVVITIIMMIAMPNVLNLISDTRKNAFTTTAKGLVKAAENKCMTELIKNNEENFEIVFEDGQMISAEKIQFSGKSPDKGVIQINNECEVIMAIKSGNMCAEISEFKGEINVFEITNPFECHVAGNSVYTDEEVTQKISEGFIPIASVEDLENIENGIVNTFAVGTEHEGDYLGGLDKQYIQIRNIEVGEAEPIGYFTDWGNYTPFTGVYDGAGLILANGIYDYSAGSLNTSGGNKNGIGFFAATETATLINMNFIDFDLKADSMFGILGGSYIDRSHIENIYISGTVSGNRRGGIATYWFEASSVTNFKADINVISLVDGEVGGLAMGSDGVDYDNIEVTGEITALKPVGCPTCEVWEVGGLIAQTFDSNMTNIVLDVSINTEGRLVGGIAGQTYASVSTENLIMDNISVRGNIVGEWRVGGIFGYSQDANMTRINFTGTVSGTNQVGGLIGAMEVNSNLNNCSFNGILNKTGGSHAGGIASYSHNNSSIRNCTVDIILNSDSSLLVSGDSFVGGAVGVLATDGSMENVTVSGEVYNNGTTTGGIIGQIEFNATAENIEFRGKIESGNTWTGGIAGYVMDDALINEAYANVELIENGTSASGSNGGGFGTITGNAVITNTGVDGTAISGQRRLGGFVGTASGNVLIENSYANVELNSTDYTVGGFVGMMQDTTTIISSFSTGNVTGTFTNTELISNVGGFVGQADSAVSFENCYATGNVASNANRVGGFGGSIYRSTTTPENLTITNSYATGTVSGNENIGGFIGISNAIISGSYATGSVTGNIDVGGFIGEAVPYLHVNNSHATGNVTGIIERTGGFIGFAGLLDDLPEFTLLVENSYATGIVNGNYEVGGFVGGIDDTGYTLRNNHATGNVTGVERVGGFVGYATDSDSIIENSYATGDVEGGITVGGFAGRVFGGIVIDKSYAIGNVTGTVERTGGFIGYIYTDNIISNSYSTGIVNGVNHVGGFVGRNYRGTIRNSYSIGSVIGTTDVGGFAGSISSSDNYETTSSYWNTQTSGLGLSAAGDGKTTEQLQQGTPNVDVYTGWNVGIWNFGTNSEYPKLIWE